MEKLPGVYQQDFLKEGVVHAMDQLAAVASAAAAAEPAGPAEEAAGASGAQGAGKGGSLREGVGVLCARIWVI